MSSDVGRWNHNTHYHRLVLEALPSDASRVLDVGCGEGILARQLRTVVPEVVGIDLDGPSLDLARRHGDDIAYVQGDFLTHDLPLGSFDAVCSIATLHHVDARAGLMRMAELVRPGGAVVVIGLARTRIPQDVPWEVAAVIAHRVLKRRHGGFWEHSAPMVWPPPEDFATMKRLAHELLPGSRYRRQLLWRYSVVWTKPV